MSTETQPIQEAMMIDGNEHTSRAVVFGALLAAFSPLLVLVSMYGYGHEASPLTSFVSGFATGGLVVTVLALSYLAFRELGLARRSS